MLQPKRRVVFLTIEVRIVDVKATSQFKDWLEGDQVSNEFLFDKAYELLEVCGEKVTIEQVIFSFDTMILFPER